MMCKEVEDNKRALFRVFLKQCIIRNRERVRQELESDRELLRVKQLRHKQRKKELNELANVKQQLIRQSNIFQSLQAQKIRVFDHLKSLIHDSHVVVDIADLAKLYELGLAVTCPDPNTTSSSITTQPSSTYVAPRTVVSTTSQSRTPLNQTVPQSTGKRTRSPSPPASRHNYTLKQRSPGPHAFQKVDDNRHHDYNRTYVWKPPNAQAVGYSSFYHPSQPATYTTVPMHVPAAYSYTPLNREPHETIHKPQATSQPHMYRSTIPQQPYITVEHPKSSHIYPDDKFYIAVRPTAHMPMHSGSIPVQQQQTAQGTKISNIPSVYPVRSVVPSIQIQPASSHSSQHSQPHQPPPSHIQIQAPSSRQPLVSHLQPQQIQIQSSSLPQNQYQQPQIHHLQHHIQQGMHIQTPHIPSPSSQGTQQPSQPQSSRIISSPHQSHSHPSHSPHQLQQQQQLLQSQSHGGGLQSSSHLIHQVRTGNQPASSQQHSSQTAISQHQQISHSGQYQQQLTHMQPHHVQQQSHIIPTHQPPPHIRVPLQHIQMRPQALASQHLQPTGIPHSPVSQQHNSLSQSHSYAMPTHLKLSNSHIPPSHHSLPSSSHHSKIVSSHIASSQHYPPVSQQQSAVHQQSPTPQHQQPPQSYQSTQQVQPSQQSQALLQMHHQNLHHPEQVQSQRQSPSMASVSQSSVIRNFNIQQ